VANGVNASYCSRTTFGDFRKSGIKNDKFFSGLGIEASAKAIAALDKKVQAIS
jgi:hypothetical protein